MVSAEPGPVVPVAVVTLVALAVSEQFVEVVAGAAAYASAWWLLREPV